MYVDGSSAQEGARERILLIRLDKKEFHYSIKFMFSITNNTVEYEALLASLRMAKKIRVQKLTVFVDFQLVIWQVTSEYEVKDPLLKKYNGLVKQLLVNFAKK